MTESNINQIIMLADLVSSIFESTNYLASHNDADSLQQDCLQALDVINHQLIEFYPGYSEQLPTPTTDFKKFLAEEITEETLELTKNWHDHLLNKLGKVLLDKIAPHVELTAETATALFNHIFNVDYSLNMKCLLLLHSSLSCGFSLPQTSYEVILDVFSSVPDLFVDNSTHPGYIFKEEEQKTFESCPVCGGKGHPYYNAFSYLMNNFDNPYLPAKLWMKCEACENLYAYQYPNSCLVLSDNYTLIQASTGMFPYTLMPAKLSLWCEILKHAVSYLKNGDGSFEDLFGLDLLEVGVGKGELLAVALEMGCSPDAVEIDTETAKTVANMLNIPIWNCDFLKYHTEKQYSIIVMGDVIEHVTNPGDALKKAHELLKDDGVLWLSTPNFEGSFTRMRQFNDAMWKEPQHITYFNFSGLKKLANDCGFIIREYNVSQRYNGSMELYLTKK